MRFAPEERIRLLLRTTPRPWPLCHFARPSNENNRSIGYQTKPSTTRRHLKMDPLSITASAVAVIQAAGFVSQD